MNCVIESVLSVCVCVCEREREREMKRTKVEQKLGEGGLGINQKLGGKKKEQKKRK